MIALLLSLALGAEPTVTADPELAPLIRAVAEHPTALRLGDDTPPTYHLRYHLIRLQGASMHASFGALIDRTILPYNRIAVELRVGEPRFDNTGFFGWENGFTSSFLPQQLTPRSVDLAAWRIVDRSYKNAIEQHSRKVAQVRPPPDHPGDYTLTGPVTYHADASPPEDPAALQEIAERLSAVFKDRPGSTHGDVHVGFESGTHAIVDSEGSRVVRGQAEVSIRAVLRIRTTDGHELVEERLWCVRQIRDLPPIEKMVAEVERMADDLVALAQAPVLTEEVVGPVLFTDAAARDLFRYLLWPQIEGTPPESPFDTFLGEIGEEQDTVRVGRRVLPPGWDVVDDPTADPSLPGAFTHDYEGTPARAVQVVESGVVRSVLTSRVPRKETAESTGHARGSFSTRTAARPSLTEVTPDRRRSARKLHRTALKLAAPYGRDWYLRVDRLIEPAVLDGRGFAFDEASLPPPVRIVRVDRDGTETVLRGARFAGVERWVLRDIVAAGASSARSVLMGAEPGSSPYGATDGLPAWIRAPDVLVGEVEVLPAPPNRRDAPVLPHPVVRAASGD